jgi:hypothetical protein
MYSAFNTGSLMVGDRVGQIVDGTDRQPHVDHALLGDVLLVRDRPGLGVEQDKRPHALGCRQGHSQRHEPSLTHAADDGPVDAEMIEQADAVVRRVPVRERLAVVLGLAEAAFVPRDDPVSIAQRRDLGSEHLPIHQEPVGQHDRRSVTTSVVEVDLLTVDRG